MVLLLSWSAEEVRFVTCSVIGWPSSSDVVCCCEQTIFRQDFCRVHFRNDLALASHPEWVLFLYRVFWYYDQKKRQGKRGDTQPRDCDRQSLTSVKPSSHASASQNTQGNLELETKTKLHHSDLRFLWFFKAVYSFEQWNKTKATAQGKSPILNACLWKWIEYFLLGHNTP